jgi:hypothetical protein
MSGSAMAHEEHADASKELHQTGTHKPDPVAGGGGHESLAGAATNPISNLIQFQIQNKYTCGSRKLILLRITPLFVRNGDVDHRPLEIEQCFPIPVAGLAENRDCPFPAKGVCASDGNN